MSKSFCVFRYFFLYLNFSPCFILSHTVFSFKTISIFFLKSFDDGCNNLPFTFGFSIWFTLFSFFLSFILIWIGCVYALYWVWLEIYSFALQFVYMLKIRTQHTNLVQLNIHINCYFCYFSLVLFSFLSLIRILHLSLITSVFFYFLFIICLRVHHFVFLLTISINSIDLLLFFL